MFCGSNQEWYLTKKQQMTGCGPSAAANMLFYMKQKENSACCSRNKADLLKFMEDTWEYVTPEVNGIPSTSLFVEKVQKYAKFHNEKYCFFVLDVSSIVKEKPSLSEVIAFIFHGLQEDVPIAFLNLDNGAEKNLEAWHWVTIASLNVSENFKKVKISICDEGITKQIDLKLWLETTERGGGFVYFLPQEFKEDMNGGNYNDNNR